MIVRSPLIRNLSNLHLTTSMIKIIRTEMIMKMRAGVVKMKAMIKTMVLTLISLEITLKISINSYIVN